MRKKALVLGGGGSKGAYQIGAYEALLELGWEFEIVVGVSIGSVNGALIVQGDFARAKDLWEQISLDSVISNGLNLTYDLDYYFDNIQKILPFLKTYAQNKGMDITPFWNALNAYLDFDKFRASSVDFGLVCLEIPSFTPCEVRKSYIKKDYLAQWILASASCFPAFPICEINKKKYIDGGYCDNLPIDLAFKMGADEALAISLRPNFESKYNTNPLVLHISPHLSLGTMLDFSIERIIRNMRLGYINTMQFFGRYDGYLYGFYPLSQQQKTFIDSRVASLLKLLLDKELHQEPASLSSMLSSQISHIGILSKISSSTPFCDKLLSLANHKHTPKLSYQDIFFYIIESYMQAHSFNMVQIWDMQKVLDDVQIALNVPSKDVMHIKKQLLSFKPDAALLEEEYIGSVMEVFLELMFIDV